MTAPQPAPQPALQPGQRQFLLHIGPFKTGSTFIQAGLDAAPDALAAQDAWRPDFWRGADGSVSQHALYDLIVARDDRTLCAQFAAIAAHPARNVIISAEPLCLLDADGVRYLAGFLGGAAVRIGFVWRALPDLLRGYWQEAVRHGGVADFGSFLAERLLDPWRDRLLNPCVTLDAYAAVFGPEAIQIVSYPDCLAAGGNVLDALLAAWGLAPIGPEPARVHPSPPLGVSEVARALQRIAHQHVPRPPGLPPCLVDAVAAEAPREPCAGVIRLSENESQSFTLDLGIAPFAALQAGFAARYGGRMDSKAGLAAEVGRVATLVAPDPGWLLHPDSVPALHALFARLAGMGPAPGAAESRAVALAEKLAGELTALRGSTSWRMTAPFRAVTAWLRRMRHG